MEQLLVDMSKHFCVHAGAVVFNDNLQCYAALDCGNESRTNFGFQTMMNCVFYNGLKRQFWNVIIHDAFIRLVELLQKLKFVRKTELP